MTGPPIAEKIEFPNGNSACLTRAPADVEVQQLIAALELPASRAVLVLNGGTAQLDSAVRERLVNLFAEVARLVIEQRITVITGGTNAGIFALFGQALEKWGGSVAPCVGVAITGRRVPSRLEPHHTHFVLVEGDSWGDETPVMYKLVAALAKNCPSLAIFASGGSTAITEMLHNVAQKREMVLIAGSGRNTDAILVQDAILTEADGRIRQIRREGRVMIFEIDRYPSELSNLIRSRLWGNNST